MIEISKQSNKQSKSIFLFVGLLLALFFVKIEIYYGNLDLKIERHTVYFTTMIALAGSLMFFLAILQRVRFDSFVIRSFLFAAAATASSFANILDGCRITDFIVNQLFFFGVAVILNLCTLKPVNVQKLSNLIFWSLIPFSVIFINYRNDGLIINAGAVNSIYYIILLLPFILINKNNIFKLIGIVDIAALTIISNKRNAFLMTAAALLIYFFLILNSKSMKSKNKVIMLFLFIVGAICIVYAYDYLVSIMNVNIFDRLSDMTSDGGSGRLDIYKTVWQAIKKFNIFQWIMGTGYNGVYRNLFFGTSAHNDFLEVLFDYGILGLAGYILIIFDLINKGIKLFKAKSEYAIAFISSLVLFMFMSMFSHIIIYPTYFIYLLIFWSVTANEKNSSY